MKFLFENLDDKVSIYYDSIPVTIIGRRYDADSWDEKEREISWEYEADRDDVFDALYDKVEAEKDLNGEDIDDYIEEHFDDLVEEYIEYLADCFYDKAVEDAQENNDEEWDDWDDSNPFEESVQEKLIQGSSDETLKKNIATEIEAGKDPKQAYAIAKSIQDKNK